MSSNDLLEKLKTYLDFRIEKSENVRIGKIDFTKTDENSGIDLNKENVFKINNYKQLCINDDNTGKYYPPEFKIICQVLNYPNYETDINKIQIIDDETISNDIKTYLVQKIAPNKNNSNFVEQVKTVIDRLKFLSTGIEKSNEQKFSDQDNDNSMNNIAIEIDTKINNKYTVFDSDKVEVYSIAMNVYEQIEKFPESIKTELTPILEKAINGDFDVRLSLNEFNEQIKRITIPKKTPKFVLPIIQN